MNPDLCQNPACFNHLKYWRNCGHKNEVKPKMYVIPKVSKKRADEMKGKKSTIGKKKKTGVNDKKLWSAFSLFIRLRDADSQGICYCFTCGLPRNYKGMDCGHGIGRQHWGTRYNEMNNHAQCKRCNGFEGGKGDVYKQKVDEKYGAGTWDLLLVKAQTNRKQLSQFECDVLEKHYRQEAEKLATAKGIDLGKPNKRAA